MEKLSVIIPVYNTEKYLTRCINSLIEQTYKNIEFIFVNDCSQGNAEEIIKSFQVKDDRIKYVTYDENRGLFRARVTGAELAKGDYIAFMDSDDYATCDYYNTLMKSAVENNSDIVVGKTIFNRMDNSNCIRNLHDACFGFDSLVGDEARKTYFGQKGLCFSWHTVWNKIYKKSLWDRCMPYYRKIDTHIIMTEDIAFSSLLFYYANSVTAVDNDGYFYCENEGASTNAAKTTLKRFTKNMSDIKKVFEFVNDFLEEVKADDSIRLNFFETKKYYSRMYRELADNTFKGNELTAANAVMEDFIPGFNEHTNADFHFFESIHTPWNSGLESIKERIIKSCCKYVSFDIFDTLVMRYVYRPDDIFLIMNKRFEQLYKTNISFDKLRKYAEAECRRRFGSSNPEYDDVTIDEIYDCLADYYNIPIDIARAMEEEEKLLEIKLTRRRNSALELMDAAIASGKKIILVSDMYLDEATIRAILNKVGIKNFERLFISSVTRHTKAKGGLFKKVINDLGIQGKDIIHIGDTWHNDVVAPKAYGIETIFFPKASEVFENKIKGINTNLCFNIGQAVTGALCDYSKAMDSLGYRCMLALAAGFYFDNPYRSFNEETDFNADPYFIGYYALGTHLIALSKWIEDNSKGYDSILFMARDGFMPMKVYNILKKNSSPRAEYVYASRKMLLPAMIEGKEDFYDLPVEFRNHTPRTILSLLDFCHGEITDIPYDIDSAFKDEAEYNSFIKYFIENIYDEDKHNISLHKCQKYYENAAKGNNIAFDMGYSGRIQTAFSRVCGRGVDVLFVHRDAKRSADMARKGNYTIKSFYDFFPYMSGLLREHILSDYTDSCIGIDENYAPVFDHIDKIYQDEFIISQMQQGALDLAAEFKNIFGEYMDYMDIKPYEASMVFEGYLRCGKDLDRRIFKASYFEDMVYGSKDKINIYEFIKSYLITLPVNTEAKNVITKRDMLETVVESRSRLIRAIAYIMLDPQLFKLYIIDILNRKPARLRRIIKIKHFLFGKPGRK